MTEKISIVGPDEQKVTFIELFFDLVFVFSVTQMVRFFHQGVNWPTIGQAVLVFWLVWWAWTQFTWTLNMANTEHPKVLLSAFAATGVAFFMAVSVPASFGERALWFAITYVVVRLIGLGLQYFTSALDSVQKVAMRPWILMSFGGLIAVLIGGYLGGTAQYWFWGLTIMLDFIAASIGAQENVNLHPAHFAERHGLFVIIALGETLIVAASGLANGNWSSDLLMVAVLAVVLTGGLWWTYFPKALPALEHSFNLAPIESGRRAQIARDAYSIVHFLMLAGIISYAVAIEEAILHPSAALHSEVNWIFAFGLTMFISGMSLSIKIASGKLNVKRVGISVLLAVVLILINGVTVTMSLGVAVLGVLLIAGMEK
ncbi:MAG: low temperature requirement protein A [Chloroflexota bacterium]